MEVVSRKDLVKPLSWITASTLTKGYGSTWQGTPSAELPGIASTYPQFWPPTTTLRNWQSSYW